MADDSLKNGITPACAGKSYTGVRCRISRGDHPRVCGEKDTRSQRQAHPSGSPPRVRGKVPHRNVDVLIAGITPACAGKSTSVLCTRFALWDHPRVCGEKRTRSAHRLSPLGSPPRVRGKGLTRKMLKAMGRITPACAGKRVSSFYLHLIAKDHPRVCGEKLAVSPADCAGVGITPACAGKRCWTRPRRPG